MRTTVRSETEAQRVSNRKPWKDGWYAARIDTAIEKYSKNDNEMIELSLLVRGRDGTERTMLDWLTDSDLGASKLRHACEAVRALERYEGGKIGQDDFPGREVEVKLITQKRNGFSQNRIEDYRVVG